MTSRLSDPGPTVDRVDALTPQQTAVLAFAARRWKYDGARQQAIRDELDLTETRYLQLLHHVIDQPAALAAQPTLVLRLRRLRDSRAARRKAG